MSISKLRGGKTEIGQQQQQHPHQQQQQHQQRENAGNAHNCKITDAASNNNQQINVTSNVTIAKCLGNFHQQQQKEALQQKQQQTYLPQTSLLKIKPFVPSLNSRLRRPIGRSYSTLSSSYLKRTSTPTTSLWAYNSKTTNFNTNSVTLGAALPKTSSSNLSTTRSFGNIKRPLIKVITHQRSKSTSSSTASSSAHRPVTAGATKSIAQLNQPSPPKVPQPPYTVINDGAIVTSQANGICRIARLPKEQEKLPDRINYDRRGLTAIPIFENEANLRLLSLQHNLINVFHIPKSQDVIGYADVCYAGGGCGGEQKVSTTTTEFEANVSHKQNTSVTNDFNKPISMSRDIATSNQHQQNQNHLHRSNANLQRMPLTLSTTTATITESQNVVPLSAKKTPQPPLTAHPVSYNNNDCSSSQLLKRNHLLQFNFNTPMAHKQQLPHTSLHYRSSMKKSKSFISSNCTTRQHIKSNNNSNICSVIPNVLQYYHYHHHRHYQNTKTDTNKMIVLLGRTNLKSFDSSASGLTNGSSMSASLLTASELEEEDYYEHSHVHLQPQLEIKNRQLSPSYGLIFQHLVFLDLYDNQIERIANLDGLPTLSVLLLGKNRITDIAGLASLRETLRVLDLHGNKITSLSNKINCLQGLKSLNLAGNQIRQINQNDFNGLLNLKELNLKRNRIRRINGFQHLVSLERLWLCHNDIHKVDDMSSIAKAGKLLEVAIENNPVSLAGDCVSFLVSYLPNLQTLSQMPITEQVRRAAMIWRKNKELSEVIESKQSVDVFNNIRREEVISNARTNWELLRSQQTVQCAMKQQRSPKQERELAKINESNETVVGFEELQEYIKLPPIQQQTQGRKSKESTTTDIGECPTPTSEQILYSGSSNSSLGPNVDSSSSSYSSDNEGTPTKQVLGPVRKKKLLRPTSVRTKATEILQHLTKESSQGEDYNNKKYEVSDEARENTKQTESASNSEKQNVNTANTPPTRTPTPVRASCRVLQMHYNNENKIKKTPPPTLNKSTPITSVSIETQSTAGSPPVTSTGTTSTITVSTVTTCKRYMRGSLMRSHVVVNGSIGGIGGRTKMPTRSLPLQQSISTITQASTNPIISIVTPAVSSVTTATVGGKFTNTTTSTNLAPNLSNSTTADDTASNRNTNTATLSSNQNQNALTTPTTTTALQAKPTAAEREREQGGDYLIEICGRYLNVYGHGALRFLDKQWNPAKANDVHTLNFSYINFNNIVASLGRIKVRFPQAENFVFRETNISCLGQLNALAELQGIVSLFVDPEGNVVTTKDLWRQYAIYRLSHWGLKLLNGVEISTPEIDEANIMYAGLSDLVLWSMPEVMLQPLLARLRLDETCTASKMSPKEWLMKPENKSLQIVVGKEALQWKKPSSNTTVAILTSAALASTLTPINNLGQQQQYPYNSFSIYEKQQQENQDLVDNHNSKNNGNSTSIAVPLAISTVAMSARERGKLHFMVMMMNTCNAVEKLHKLETLWPSLLLEIVRNTLLDYSQLDAYLRSLMSEIMK